MVLVAHQMGIGADKGIYARLEHGNTVTFHHTIGAYWQRGGDL